ncbi:SDR family oxidoreductase [Pseudonocardia kunmingensis]|uniref:SDR family oxidoreductase n=1 Tax=Pseudonocardia kunmingensis TaxID=630975 RepID=UPI0011519C84|nr:SDR family oxidoreductase [Pseudonocardia kunmingensis]
MGRAAPPRAPPSSRRPPPARCSPRCPWGGRPAAGAAHHGPDGIRVNCVAPGSVRTAMLEDSARQFAGGDTERAFDEWGSKHVIGRIIEPREVAAAIAFLASPDASAITGTTLRVDGGLTARLAV